VAISAAQDVVDEPLLGCVLQPPDDADDRQRQDHGQVEDGLVEPGPADLAVEQDGEEHPDRRGDEHQERQPDDVVRERRPEERVRREQALVVLEPEELGRLLEGHPDPVPVGQGDEEGDDGRAPDEDEVEDQRDTDHQPQDHLVAPGQ
jgi:hypothetical protein